jgi:hypothetical protein
MRQMVKVIGLTHSRINTKETGFFADIKDFDAVFS